MKDEVDILLMENTAEESFNGRPGLISRFMFETSLRETDRIVSGYKESDDVSGNQFSLANFFLGGRG